MPFGLSQCLRASGVWCCGGDILAALDQDAALERLGEVAGNRGFWPSIRTQLLDNAHRLDYCTKPNVNWSQEEQAAEQALVACKLADLSDADKAELAARIRNSTGGNRKVTTPAACRKSPWMTFPASAALSTARGLPLAFANSPPPAMACSAATPPSLGGSQ